MNLIILVATLYGIFHPVHVEAKVEVKPVIALEAPFVETVPSTIVPEPPEAPPKSVEEKIREKAIEYKVDPNLAVKIAKAESNLNPNAKNSKSSASGIYQFLDGTFVSYCIRDFQFTHSLDNKLNPDIQIECAVRMLSEGGIHHWDASRFIWGK